MDEAELRVRNGSDRLRVLLVCDVCDLDVVFVGAGADLGVPVVRIRSAVHDTVSVVRVGRRVATGKHRVIGRTDIHHVQAATTGVGADRVSEAGVFVDCQVVGAAEIAVNVIGQE